MPDSNMTNTANYLECTRSLFQYYRQLGDKALAQVQADQLGWHPSAESNSISVLVRHLSGNMHSRFTDFLTSDGEKPWRNRDTEFEGTYPDKAALLAAWNAGWDCLFAVLNSLEATDLEKIIYIRNQGHTVLEALNRQLAHYSYHIGQLVYLCRILAGTDWQSLSIPKGESANFNKEKFEQDKSRQFFTDK